ncbi:hypothetical protein FXO37_14614 [Capsicum annuum]|nr:hypothetical protein FXO37_14614 [Capsicum annuum]
MSKASKTTKPPPLNKGKTLSKRPPAKTNKREEKIDGLLDIFGRGYEATMLLEDLKDKIITKKHKEQLCLVWLGHLKSFLPSESRSRTTRIRFLIKGSLGVELTKKELAGSTVIRRSVRQGQSHIEALHNQPTAIDLGATSGGVAGRVVDVGGSHDNAATSHDDDHVDAQEKINMFKITPNCSPPHSSSRPCSHCKCKECMDRQDKLFQKIDVLTNTIEELKSKRGVISYKNVRQPYTPTYVDEILCFMRGRQLAYSDTYDAGNRIMDLNIYSNFKNRFDDLIQLASTLGGPGFDSLVSMFEWDEDMIEYFKGKRSYPHGKEWIKAKRILEVMNMDAKYFLALEILLENGMMKVYDCNLPVFDEDNFFTKMYPLLDLFRSLLRQCKLMNYLSLKVLNEKWDFEGRNKDKFLSKNSTDVACGLYALTDIECLLTGIEMSNPITLLCDNAVVIMQEVWAYGVITKRLDPVYVKEKDVETQTP